MQKSRRSLDSTLTSLLDAVYLARLILRFESANVLKLLARQFALHPRLDLTKNLTKTRGGFKEGLRLKTTY